MKTRARPPDHLKRDFVDRRTYAPDTEPPPSSADIQRELGWDRIDAERKIGKHSYKFGPED
jgi:hypothetical protein